MKKIFFSLIICLIMIACGQDSKIENEKELGLKYENYVVHKTSAKYQSNVRLEIENGKFANIQEMKKIFEKVVKENKGFENYFTNFYITSYGLNNPDINLFQFNKSGKEEITISPLWIQSYYNSQIMIPSNYNKINGFIKYSDVDLRLGESFEQIEQKIGKTIFEKDGNKVYIVFNERTQIIGYLLLVPENNKLKDLIFVLPYPGSDEEYERIESYFLGNKDIQIKDFYDIGGINIKLKDFKRKFLLARNILGDSKDSIYLPEENDIKEILYDGDKGFLIKFKVENEEISKITLIQKGTRTDEEYSNLRLEMMFLYSLSKNNILDRGVYDILEKLGFSHEKYEKREEYSKEYEEGNINYRIIMDNEVFIFEIENI